MSEKIETFVVDLPEPRRQARASRAAPRAPGKSPTRPAKRTPAAKRYAHQVSGERIRSKKALKTIFLEQRGTRRPSVFVSWKAHDFASLAEVAHEEKGNLRLLVLEELSPPRKEYLQTLFRTVVSPGNLCLLPWDELVQAISADNRSDLFVAGVLNNEEQVIVLHRGTFDRLSIPFSWFRRESAPDPDFTDLEIIDHGQTIRLGSFEASADAILYDFDAEYRARAKKRQLELDDSFGGSLRRLRELKGIRRSDFPSISAKEIARIERNEVREPRDETIRAIARRLGVSPEEIDRY